MQVYYTKDEEHLPYILASGVWHYYQFTENVINKMRDKHVVDKYLKIQRDINEIINPAVKNPILADSFAIVCDDEYINKLLIQILQHYLTETKAILRTIEDPVITEKCLEDVDVIQNKLIKAIDIAS